MELVKITEVKGNKDNPRIIKDDKFKKLVQSIKDFPEMLKIRPIVVNGEMTVLGGNMRLKACQKAGLKEVWIIKADNLTEEQQKEFIIKDNSGFGEWDWDTLANEWDVDKLEDWGLDVPSIEDFTGVEEQEIEFSEYLDESHNYVVLLFDSEVDWLSAQTHFDIGSVHSMRANGKPWSKGIGRVLNGAKYLRSIKDE
ncbi:MAG: ParB N-terminal domain-containing protein [Lacinutrix sp.]|uniref:ParB N-terminal domain-containing protein n=1 Tax=Lacinutrix sp. TaxID=1937692 RepID=UPI0030B156E7